MRGILISFAGAYCSRVSGLGFIVGGWVGLVDPAGVVGLVFGLGR